LTLPRLNAAAELGDQRALIGTAHKSAPTGTVSTPLTSDSRFSARAPAGRQRPEPLTPTRASEAGRKLSSSLSGEPAHRLSERGHRQRKGRQRITDVIESQAAPLQLCHHLGEVDRKQHAVLEMLRDNI